MNIRSLKKHIDDLKNEPEIAKADVLMVQQTCLSEFEDVEEYQIDNYRSHFNSLGDGKGIAIYFMENFDQVCDISLEKYQI